MSSVAWGILVFFAAAGISAAETRLNCTWKSGDPLSADGSDRLSPKMELKISEREAQLSGRIWGKQQSDSAFRSDPKGDLLYSGFPLIQEGNKDCSLKAEKPLLAGKPGKIQLILGGDGKNSVTLHYDYFCQ
jgi:hypothetical protein